MLHRKKTQKFWQFQKKLYLCTRKQEMMAGKLSWLERMIHNHEVPGSIPGPATRLRFRLLGGFHSWRSFLFFTLGLRYGLQGST